MPQSGNNIDPQLVAKCLKAHPAAQRELYEVYFNYAMSISLRYCQSREEAIEVVNDGFMKVFASLAQYDPSQPFKGWLRRIVINASIDHYRKNRKHYEGEVHLYVDAGASPDVFAKFSADEIMACVQQLPASYRIVFVLFAVEGFKHHEIAKMLDISEGTSKSNLTMARNKLKELLINRSQINRVSYAR